ncbi:MAG: copper homeostasis protein CutC [Propionibacteriales bacterium]|nr:copper homeostasis protein CutC [Propionibacteriales bacterium]
MTRPSLSAAAIEVVAVHPTDAERAQAGGADRLHVCAFEGAEARALEPARVSAIVRATDLPVRVTLRLSAGYTTQGGEFTRLIGLVSDYLALGVEGFVFGFLTPDLEVDVGVCKTLVDELGGAPWTFDRAFDHALEAPRAWRAVAGLDGLDGIHTAGAALGLSSGFDDLIALAESDPRFASTAVAAGGVRPEHVPWLVLAGVTRVHLGASVRPGGSFTKSHVDSGFVRSWRLLLDDAIGPGQVSGSAG